MENLEELLKEKITEEQEYKDEAELIEEIGTIPKQDAAALISVSERQLLRYKERYNLPTVKVGRETHYYLVPLIRVIRKFKLNWVEKVYQRILDTKKIIPKI